MTPEQKKALSEAMYHLQLAYLKLQDAQNLRTGQISLNVASAQGHAAEAMAWIFAETGADPDKELAGLGDLQKKETA